MAEPTPLEKEAQNIEARRQQLRERLQALEDAGKGDSNDAYDLEKAIEKATETLVEVYKNIETLKPKDARAAADRTQSGPQGSIWEPDENGVWVERVPGTRANADDEITKALSRQQREAERDERLANQQAGKGYATDNELLERTAANQRLGLNERESKLADAKWEKEKEVSDREQARKDLQDERDERKSGADIARTGAETGRIGAETDLTRQTVEQRRDELPGIISERQASEDLAKAQAQRQKRADVSSTEGAFITSVNNEGVQQTRNQNYQPVTQAEIAAQTARMQAEASAKWDQLSARVDGSYTNDQARKDFDEWWAGNVEPQKASLLAAQDEAALARKKAEEDMRSSNLLRAQAGGDAALRAFEATKGRFVGEGAQQAQQDAISRGTMKGADLSGAFTPAQDPQKLYDDAVAKALAQISPTAAAATGGPMPNYQSINIGDTLNRSQYGGPPPPPPAAPGGVVTPPAVVPPPPPPPPLTAPPPGALIPGQPLMGYSETIGVPGPEHAMGPNSWMERIRRMVAEQSQYTPA